MKISYNWIKQFLKIDLLPEQVSEILTDLGLEVEGVSKFESVKGGLEGVIVGEVLQCIQHPDADRLQVAEVDLGKKIVQIVCGASNLAQGQKVAVATEGTSLFNKEGKKLLIKKSKIRGQDSHGMICAEDELGLGEFKDGIMVLDPNLKSGTPCNEVFDIKEDTVFEIGLTPNRSDAMSHMGVARDLKAYCHFKGIEFKWSKPVIDKFSVVPSDQRFSVVVESEEKATRYMGVIIKNLSIKPSPDWLKNRLKAIGITPKNNVVDITNFVLHDLGQPLHAFDLNKVKGGIIVKNVPQDTPFVTLDGVKRKLHAEDLMICDHQKPLCIAGVFGGQDSGVNENTTSIFLESAYFDPVSIRKSAKRHGLNTDASFRFERGIDPEITSYALKYAANLIVELAGGSIQGEPYIFKRELPNAPNFMLRFDQIKNTIGQEISKNDVCKILTGLEIKIEHSSHEGMLIQIPYYRVDVTRPADVIEEILRVYGYNNIVTSDLLESRLPTFVSSNDHQIAERLSNHLVSLGFHEMINNSISSPDYGEISKSLKDMKRVNIINPLGQELSQMRSSLLPGALEVLAFNINRQSKSLKFFEFGKTYQQANGGYKEEKYLSIAISGDVYNENWNVVHQPQVFFYFKGIIQQLLKKNCSIHWQESSSGKDIFSDGLVFSHKMKTILDFGFIKNDILEKFNINQEVLFAEINFSILADLVKNNNVHYNEIPKFPQIRRDFSLLIDDSIPFEALKKIALNTEKNVLKNVQLFDVYEGNKLPKGKKSYGVSFYFQDPKKTMTDKYIDKIMGKLQNQFEKEFGAQLR
ncbi:MAG: phenylalanine--tRNA ligase subunit beta [Bacteroidota bacterium]|nr:phenylalanine--tRNA ligase subunit beta [Bacteroidota bacterium]